MERQHGQGDLGELVPDDGEHLRQPQHAERRHGEHGAVAGTGANRPTTAAAVPIAVIPVGLPGTVDQAAAMATWLRPAALAQ